MSKTFTSILIILSVLLIYSTKLDRDIKLDKQTTRAELNLLNKEQKKEMSYLETNTSLSLIEYTRKKIELWANTTNIINFVHDEIGVEGAKLIAQINKERTTLKFFIIKEDTIGDEGVKILENVIQRNEGLEYIDLSSNKISKDGAKTLANALEKNINLTVLNLNCNILGDDGLSDLIKALWNKNISRLHLYKINIESQGVRKLFEFLLNKKTIIKELDIGNNNIGIEGIKELANFLKDNQILILLSLEFIEFGFEGIRILTDALTSFKRLDTLTIYLRRYEITKECYRLLEEWRKNKIEIIFRNK